MDITRENAQFPWVEATRALDLSNDAPREQPLTISKALGRLVKEIYQTSITLPVGKFGHHFLGVVLGELGGFKLTRAAFGRSAKANVFTTSQLKIIQEVIAIGVFIVLNFAVGRSLPRWNEWVAFGLIGAAIVAARWE